MGKKTNKKFVQVEYSEEGRVVGDSHPKAVLTNEEVELIRDLREGYGMGYDTLAWIFRGKGVSRHGIKKICLYERRNVVAVRGVYRRK